MIIVFLLVGVIFILWMNWMFSSVQWTKFQDMVNYIPANMNSMNPLLLISNNDESSFKEELQFVK
jgi:hypothetical protein